jgi:hypothetical protein
MGISYINIFISKALQNLPKFVFLVWKQTIWQPWGELALRMGDTLRGCSLTLPSCLLRSLTLTLSLSHSLTHSLSLSLSLPFSSLFLTLIFNIFLLGILNLSFSFSFSHSLSLILILSFSFSHSHSLILILNRSLSLILSHIFHYLYVLR